MKTIAETLNYRVWKAIDAMITGLEEYSKLKHFEINMQTFGNYDFKKNTCLGCAATCALHKVANKAPEKNHCIITREGRSRFTGFDIIDIIDFESAINKLRYGNLTNIFKYMNKYKNIDKIIMIENKFNLEVLNSFDWKENLENYKKLRDYLKEQNI